MVDTSSHQAGLNNTPIREVRVTLPALVEPAIEFVLVEPVHPSDEQKGQLLMLRQSIDRPRGDAEPQSHTPRTEERAISRDDMQMICTLAEAVRADRQRLADSTARLRAFLGRSEEATAGH